MAVNARAMETTPRAHNPDAGGCSSNGASATGRGDVLAVQLYELISSGHDALAYNVDPSSARMDMCAE